MYVNIAFNMNKWSLTKCASIQCFYFLKSVCWEDIVFRSYNKLIVFKMLTSKFSIGVVIILNLCLGLRASENDKSDKIIIEGGERELKKIFNDFYEVKNAINDLKLSFEEQRALNESKHKELPMFDQRFDTLPEKCANCATPKDCGAATSCTQRSGIYKIRNEQFSSEPFFVECDTKTDNGDWLVIQRRHDGSVDFYRDWEQYENGFGDIDGEFFIGLKKLHALTNYNGPQELLVVMEDSNQTSAFAKYDTFAIGNATELYTLKKVGKYSGTAGDSLLVQLGMKFTTKDHDNDIEPNKNCAVEYTGAWWYRACHSSNLNGKYNDNTYAKGVIWFSYRGHTQSLPYVQMMIRRRRIKNILDN